MTPSNFIISKLKLFIEEFPQARVRYEYDDFSDTHFIEVVPNEIYHLDQSYIEWEGKIFDEFVEVFPYDNICFLSDDAIVGLNKIDFELIGVEFEVLYSTTHKEISVESNVVEVEEFIYTRNLFNFTFFSSNNTDTYYNEISKSFLGTTTACSLAA